MTLRIVTTSIALVSALIASAALASSAPPASLTVSQTVASERAPWPEKTLVLLWMEGQRGRIYPLPLLDRHGTLLDEQSGRRVAATWSPKSGSAMLLALPGDLVPTSATAGADGWRRVRVEALKSEWLPGVDKAVVGTAKQLLQAVPETAVLPLRLARRLAPNAQVVVSNEPPARLNASWQATRKQVLIPTLAARLTVVLARGEAAAWRHGALPRDGLLRTDVGGLAALVVRAHHVTRAFMAPLTPTQRVGVDPWTGAPWLWTEGIGLWNGLTGARLDNGQSATQALTVTELTEAAFRTHWPKHPLHEAGPKPTAAP
ncbi:MAG: hypothetical protein ACPGU1_00235 [Myxococcota bacterium]